MISLISSLSFKLYLNSLVYHRNFFGSSSKVFGNLQKSLDIFGNFRKFSENVRERSSGLRNDFGKSSEGGRKSSENHQKRRHQHVYTRRENIRIYNIKEESDENTEEQVRNLFVAKLRIPQNDVDAIRFERVHRIPVKPSSQRSQSRGPRPVIVRFSHYQNKEFVRSFYKNLKGTKIGISDDFPREVEEIHKTLYPVLKQAKREQKRAFFNFDKLIINGQIYRGEETKNLPYYGNIMKNFV